MVDDVMFSHAGRREGIVVDLSNHAGSKVSQIPVPQRDEQGGQTLSFPGRNCPVPVLIS